MEIDDLPLFELYTRLRQAGLPLGLNEYSQALKALQAGFGFPDQKSLSRLCCALWVKNHEEAHIFNYHFAEVLGTKHLSISEVTKDNVQRSKIYHDAAIVQKFAAQTTRQALLGIFVATVLFLAILAGSKFVPSLKETNSELENSQLTEPEEFLNSEPLNLGNEITPKQTLPSFSLALLVFLGTGMSWLFIHQLVVLQKATSVDDTEVITAQMTVSHNEMIDASNNDEVVLTKVTRNSSKAKNTTSNIKVLRQDEYFPLTRRQMKQGWRYLRRNSREGSKTEFDIEGTIHQIGCQGLFMGPVMRAPRKNCTDLVFLLDHDGSMVPFQTLSKRLVETAIKAGRLGNAATYYFRNCPTRHLYYDLQMQESETISRFLRERLSSKSVIVVISDAGAARGGFNPARIRKTQVFLTQLNRYVRYIAWLNPLPRLKR